MKQTAPRQEVWEHSKISLHQHFASTDGHATAGVVVESLVLKDNIDYLLNRHLSSDRLESLRKAELRALHAKIANCTINMNFLILANMDCILRAMRKTISAMDAAVWHFDDLLSW